MTIGAASPLFPIRVAVFAMCGFDLPMRRIRVTRAEVQAIEKFARMSAGDAAVRLSPEEHDAIEGKDYVVDEGHLNSTAMEILLREDVKGRLYLVVAGHLPRIAPTVEVIDDAPRQLAASGYEPQGVVAMPPPPAPANPAPRRRPLFTLKPPRRIDPGVVLTPSALELRDRLLHQFGRWPEIGIIPPVSLDAYERRDVRQLMDAGHLEFDQGSYILRDPSPAS